MRPLFYRVCFEGISLARIRPPPDETGAFALSALFSKPSSRLKITFPHYYNKTQNYTTRDHFILTTLLYNYTPITLRPILGDGFSDLSMQKIHSVVGKSLTSPHRAVLITLHSTIELPTYKNFENWTQELSNNKRFYESVHSTVSVRVVKVYWFV